MEYDRNRLNISRGSMKMEGKKKKGKKTILTEMQHEVS